MGEVEESSNEKGKGKGKGKGMVEGGEIGGMGMGEFDAKKLKKGFTVVIPEPKRYGVNEGKQGYVKCAWGDLRLIPFSLDKLRALSWKIAEEHSLLPAPAAAAVDGQEDDIVRCQGCGKSGVKEDLSRCRGCGEVWYCDKECQTQGWSEKGHKGECKILKFVGGLELGDRGWEA